jgi:hypothetical protein
VNYKRIYLFLLKMKFIIFLFAKNLKNKFFQKISIFFFSVLLMESNSVDIDNDGWIEVGSKKQPSQKNN